MIELALALALTAPTVTESNVAARYREDPLALRRQLRHRLDDGRSNALLLRVLRAEVGDHSLDDLAEGGPRAGLQLQARGFEAWERGSTDEAVGLLLRSALRIRAGGGRSEALFSLYWAAAALAEEERFETSLRVAATALSWRDPKPAPLLDALLFESCGYALWLLDRLPESAEAFSRSLDAWRQVGYRTALVAGHNNLATLAEALRLPERAAAAYRAAVREAGPETHRQVALQLWRNFSLFQARRGSFEPARRLLERARPLESLDPVGFVLWEAQLTDSAELLATVQPDHPSQQVEQLQVAGRIALKWRRLEAARQHFDRALELAVSARLPLLARQAAEELGLVLESQGRFAEAEGVYRSAFLAAPVRIHRDPARPYLRLVTPLFSGWLRSLAALGRSAEARARIHAETRRRYESASFFHNAPAAPLAPATRPRPYTVVELWPAGDRVLVWVDMASRTAFRSLPWGDRQDLLVRDVVTGFAEAASFLPPPPPGFALRELHRALIEPLADLLHDESLLMVPHGPLQTLPFELLTGPDGSYLGDRKALSYLPSPAVPAAAGHAAEGEILLVSRHLDGRPEAIRERTALRRLFPASRQRTGLPPTSQPLRWLHVSTHLEVADSNWLASTVVAGRKRLTLREFAGRVPPVELLTLGACDAATARWSRSPFWMGLSEVLLAGGVRSLLVTRWKLDELSSELFVRFYERARAGTPLDRALLEARRDFRQAGGASGEQRRRHPFYWAGVVYVGEPGRILYPQTPAGPAVLLAGLLLGLLFRISGSRQKKQTAVTGAETAHSSES